MPGQGPLRFDATVSLGHLIMVFTLMVSMVAAWMANRERSISNGASISQLSVEVGELEARVRILERAGP